MTRRSSFPKFDGLLIILGFLLAGISIFAAFYVSNRILDHFYEGQRKAAVAQAKGVLNVLTMDFQNFSDHLSDYSYWNETCDYIAGKNPTFLKDNFNLTSFYFTRLDLALIFGADGGFIGGVFETPDRRLADVPPEIIEKTKELRPLFDTEHSRHSRIGFLNSPFGIFMLVARPVADSNAQGPIRGFVVFGRRLDDEQMQLLSKLTGMQIRLKAVHLPLSHDDGQVVDSKMIGDANIVLTDTLGKKDGKLDTKVVLHDIQGETCYRLELTPPGNVAEAVQHISTLVRVFLVAVAMGFAVLASLTALEFHRHRRELGHRIRTQEQLEQSITRAEKLAEEAQAADRAKGDFLAMISHEIRTPLNAIIGFVSLLDREKLDPQQATYLKNVHTGGELLLGILSDILDFSRIDAGQMDIHPEPHDIRELVEAVRGLHMASAHERGNRIETRIAEEVPRILDVDGIRLGQVLGNLVSNAVKFTDNGVINIHVYPAPGASPVEGAHPFLLSFSVEDTGIGIPAEHRDKLFKSFSQVDSARSRRYGGTGLGLVICQRIVERMGGSIQLHDADTGTRISFDIPVTSSALPTQSSFGFPHEHKPATGNVLIVDDNKTNAQLLEILLRKFGAVSTHVSSGVDALHAYETHSFRLVLMDLQMPGMDGIETTHKIRELETRRNFHRCPIVAVTAAATVADRENCLAAGMDDYLTKPFRPAQIEQILKKHLSSRPV